MKIGVVVVRIFLELSSLALRAGVAIGGKRALALLEEAQRTRLVIALGTRARLNAVVGLVIGERACVRVCMQACLCVHVRESACVCVRPCVRACDGLIGGIARIQDAQSPAHVRVSVESLRWYLRPPQPDLTEW